MGSELLKNYRSGKIVVSASTVDEARDMAREYILRCIHEEIEDDALFISSFDEDDTQRYITRLEDDLRQEPKIHDILLIGGSE